MMAFFELAKVKERIPIPSADTADDNMLNNFGAEADNEVYNELYIVANRYGKLQALPAVDVPNGLIGGLSAPQSVKDASSNRVVALYHSSRTGDLEKAKHWMAMSKNALESFIVKLDSEADVFSAWV